MELTEVQIQIMQGKVCPYCSRKTEFIDSSIVYGRGNSFGMIYYCCPCHAYVGVHKGSDRALGRVANGELRKLKIQTHEFFDKIWQLEHLSRTAAYAWLSEKLQLPVEYTHIGMFSEKTCKDVIYYSKQFLNDMRRLDIDFGDKPKTEYYEI